MGVGGQFHALAALLWKRDLKLTLQGVGWAPAVVWMGHYTDYAIPATFFRMHFNIIFPAMTNSSRWSSPS